MGWLSFLQNNKKTTSNLGLAVDIEDLLAQQKYVPYLSLKNNQTSAFAGDVKSAFKGRGMEFEEVRTYNFGDNIRDIDWRVTARKNEPYTKIFAEEKDREIVVFLDLSASMIFGTRKELKSVTAAKIAALVGWAALRNKDRFGMLIYDGSQTTYYKPQNTLQNLMTLFKQLADKTHQVLQKQHFGDMSTALNTLQLHLKGQGTIFILSDFYRFNQEKFKKIAALAQRHDIYCLNVFDVIEEVAPADGVYAAQYGTDKVVFNSSTDNFRLAYQQYFADNRATLKKNCQKFLCKYVEIRTDMPIFKQLSIG